MAERVHFGKLGVILATAGSAVGLGNIWRFPYMTGQNGGSAFILIYMVCVLMLGIPGMIAEFIVGRHGASNAAKAYQSFHKGRLWGLIGLTGVITAIIILGFYAVVSGISFRGGLWQHARRRANSKSLLPNVFSRPHPPNALGNLLCFHHTHCHNSWRTRGNRTRFQRSYAYPVCPTHHYRMGLVFASQCR